LLARTAAIAAMRWAAGVDHLVFHEDDLSEVHQRWLNERSALPLKFIDVTRTFKLAEERVAEARRLQAKGVVNPHCPEPLHHWKRPGYQAMCWFWFYDILTYLAGQYHQVLRGDDDCVLLNGTQHSEWLPHGSAAASPEWQGMELESGLSGMHQLFAGLQQKDPSLAPFPRQWRSPYSNLMAFDAQWAMKDRRMQQVYDAVNATGCVWSTQWGDLQLWGAAITLLQPDHVLDRVPAVLEYFHGSHARTVTTGTDGGVQMADYLGAKYAERQKALGRDVHRPAT